MTTSYEWHPDGELHKVTTATEKTTEYENYKRGQPGHVYTAEKRIQFLFIDDNGL